MLKLSCGAAIALAVVYTQATTECSDLCTAALQDARRARREYRLDDADRLLDSAVRLAPRSTAARTARADFALALLDVRFADSVYRAVLSDDSVAVNAIMGRARVAFLLDSNAVAESLIARALEINPRSVDALLFRASMERDAQRLAESAADIMRALALDSLSAGAHVSRSVDLRSRGDLNGSFAELQRALSIDPYLEGAHGNLGNGASIKSYQTLPLELDSAARLVRAGRYHEAMHAYMGIVRTYPDLGLAHYGVTVAQRAIRDAKTVAVQRERERFRARPMPEAPEVISRFVIGFQEADADVRKVVLEAMLPLVRYIPTLVQRNATFEILPFDKPLWALSGSRGLRGTRTFDHRLWDDVKGQGGQHGVAGEESVRDVSAGRYNTLAHEFMHQVHGMAMSADERKEVTRLYANAMRNKLTLDYYAASNEREYVAQAYEAFISESKLVGQKVTAGNSRARLKRLDPDVFAFLERITTQSRP
jgi:tetratricopeptide (TPR) repeat protein